MCFHSPRWYFQVPAVSFLGCIDVFWPCRLGLCLCSESLNARWLRLEQVSAFETLEIWCTETKVPLKAKFTISSNHYWFSNCGRTETSQIPTFKGFPIQRRISGTVGTVTLTLSLAHGTQCDITCGQLGSLSTLFNVTGWGNPIQ